MSGAPQAVSVVHERPAGSARPRLGFLGVGWIGRHRMRAIQEAAACDIVAVVEPNENMAREAVALAPGCIQLAEYEELLRSGIDGIVIATPSALHANQAIAALERGISVFCQKPLGRNFEETQRVIAAARAADRLLCVDMSYRFVEGIRKTKELVQSGRLGKIFAADLVFHNAYGPDKPWFYDRRLSGGGCVIDLGIHLVDLALWSLNFPRVNAVTSRLLAKGKPVSRLDVEDYATARLDLENGATVQLACSWKLAAGCEALISAHFYGTPGGAAFRNLDGSFYHF